MTSATAGPARVEIRPHVIVREPRLTSGPAQQVKGKQISKAILDNPCLAQHFPGSLRSPSSGHGCHSTKKKFPPIFFLMKSEITSAMFGRRLHDTQISSSEAHAVCLQRAGRCTASCGLAARAQGISTGARPHLWPKHPPIGSEHPCVPHDRLQPGNRAPGASLPSISNKL